MVLAAFRKMVFVFYLRRGEKSSSDVFTFLLLDELYKDATSHLLSIQSFHLAQLTYEEISFESLKAVPFLIPEIQIP